MLLSKHGVIQQGVWLQEPGSADLTAWVDFGAVRQAVSESLSRVQAHGPVAQGHFCLANGMEQRLDDLLSVRCPPSPLFVPEPSARLWISVGSSGPIA